MSRAEPVSVLAATKAKLRGRVDPDSDEGVVPEEVDDMTADFLVDDKECEPNDTTTGHDDAADFRRAQAPAPQHLASNQC